MNEKKNSDLETLSPNVTDAKRKGRTPVGLVFWNSRNECI